MTESLLVLVGAVGAALVAALIARGVKISEFRQAWINGLREDISLYVSRADQWIEAYIQFNSETQQSEKKVMAAELDNLKYESLHVLRRIELRFKLDDNAGNALIEKLWDLLDPGKLEPMNQYSSWRALANNAILDSRSLLKEEWEATKSLLKNIYKRRSK